MTDILFNNKPYICKVFTTHVGTKAIKLYRHDGEQTLQATIWLSHLSANEVAVRDYYDTQGILPILIEYKVIHSPHRYLETYPICYLYEDK